jgi:hypothetical protein
MTSGSSAVTSGQSGAGAAGVLTLDPANANFGDVTVGVRKVIIFRVTNPPTNASFSATLSGPDARQFLITGGTCFGLTRPSLAPPNPCSMQVMFAPTSTGVKRASLDVTANATASLTGTGLTNNEPPFNRGT